MAQHSINNDHMFMLLICRTKSLFWLSLLLLQALLSPAASSLEAQSTDPIILATNMEYKELLDALEAKRLTSSNCDVSLLTTLNQHLNGRIKLQYYPGRRIALAGESGRVQGVYYSPKPLGQQQIPNMVAIEGSLIKESTLFFSATEIVDIAQLQDRPIAYLSAYRRIADQVASGYYAPSSVHAQSIGQMIKLLAAGRIDGFFIISRYRKLAKQLYFETTNKTLHNLVYKDDIELYLHIHEQYPELIKELESHYKKIQQDPLFINNRLNVDQC